MAEMQIGEIQNDTSIYVGKTKLLRRKIYAAPEDIKDAEGKNLTLTFGQASFYASKLNDENYLGHNDWRVPTLGELRLLSHNQKEGALKGTFNNSADKEYWSSKSFSYSNEFGDPLAPSDSSTPFGGYAVSFDSGRKLKNNSAVSSFVRLVRS